jgi:hypothetical protein
MIINDIKLKLADLKGVEQKLAHALQSILAVDAQTIYLKEKTMKKVLTIALTGVLAAAALAVESDPSNTVGFISHATTPNVYTAFSACPMGLGAGVAAADVIGGQGASGDKILRFTTAYSSFLWTADGTWGGLTLDYNGTYMYRNGHGVAGTLVIAGDVIAEGTTVTMADFGVGFKGFGNPLPMDVDLDTDDLTLAADGFASGDKILDWNGAGWASYTYNGTSYGVDLTAGKSYVFKTAAPFTWDYTVGGGAMAEIEAPVRVARTAASAGNLR